MNSFKKIENIKTLIECNDSIPCLSPAQTKLGIDGLSYCFPIPDDKETVILKTSKYMLKSKLLTKAVDRPDLWKRYKHCFRMTLPNGSGACITICLKPRSKKTKSFSYLDFNPSKMTKDDWYDMHSIMMELFNGEHLSYMKYGHYSRVDLCIDLLDININQIIAEALGTTKFKIYGSGNAFETLSFGAKGSRKQISIYNKYVQIVDTTPGRKTLEDFDFSHDEKTRIELKLRQKTSQKQLKAIPALLSTLNVALLDTVPDKLNADEQNFIDAVSIHGLQKVIKRYKSSKTRKKRRELIDKIIYAQINFDHLVDDWPKLCRKIKRRLLKPPR
ncbi:hypothetical protein ACMXYN_15040 [Neptuniibacter sp. PT8_73]|uniref:hypothetical protein n=1 Tax=Neptuniibacter sp. PT8_73 TaxID=3398206 RepID=UPI0039F44B87